MNKLKKVTWPMAMLLMMGILSGCGSNDQVRTDNNNHNEVPGGMSAEINQSQDAGQKFSIVSTIFPQYDWIRQIIGEDAGNIELTLLLDNGVDLHNYQPTTDDVITITECDMFIYVGGESDTWVNDILKNAVNKDMVVVDLMDVLGDAVKEEEIKEGMEHDHEEETEFDEHVWLSLNNAKTLCEYLAKVLVELDGANASAYNANLAAYTAQLDALNLEYQEAALAAPVKTLLFGDRFPFRYLVDDYGLDYYAAFSGCSAETEASFETIVFLANKVDELGLKNIMVIDTSDQSVAKTVVQNTETKNQNILVLDSMQSVTAADLNAGTSYLTIMENNLKVLKEALK